MSQVTRCPSCGTRFKVVADQLRISQGWVRCGRCQSVFDASEDLQTVADESLQAAAETSKDVVENEPQVNDFSSDDAPESIAEPDQVAAEPEVPEKEILKHEAADSSIETIEEHAASDSQTVGTDEAQESELHHDSDLEAEVEQAVQPDGAGTEADAQDAVHDSALEGEIASEAALLSTDVDDVRREVEAEQSASELESDSVSTAAAVDEPGFVREARRKAFWHSTGMRVALLLGSVIAFAGVVGQYAWHQRDALAAQHPQLAPALQQVCARVGCTLGARREIADVVISGSGFKQLADAHQYQWSLTLENRSDAPVATPQAELTLTDAQDKPLLRRVVDLQTLGAPAQLQAHQEWSVNMPVQVQELSAPVSGYRALVFYP